MKSYGNAMPGGPLVGSHVPLPTATVVHTAPVVAQRKPLPALPDAPRDYIRAWANSHGMRVCQVGALPRKVLDAYEEATR